ncbi:MAG: hypothetical protein KBG05_00375 [Lachnospiraceae bacterium]|nr:hypothetical protein [Lachnospiraceae bacterium]
MDFLYRKHPKGSYEHAKYKRTVDIIITLFLFLLSLCLFVIGYVATGSKKNLLTIVAVLGLLPACKMVVDVIMCFRVKPVEESVREGIDASIGKLYGLYHMYFTSYDKNFPIDHLVITSNSVIGLCSNPKFDEKLFITHLKDYMRKDGIKDITIKIFDDYNKYLNRLSEINNLDDETTTVNIGVRNLILNITF